MQVPSPERHPERQFVRYRDHGDLPALAAVFDAFAGHLLLIAGHLVRDGALAEDLVQTTFVEAMRSAHRYDAQRPLLPWLVRILTHHAKKLRRQRNRPDDPRPMQRSASSSAADAVLDKEVLAAIERALAELPVPYRQVLTLRLVHDLSPTAIAHALGCPPNTVKTRLKRGLALLRQHLPAGIATTVALLLATGRGLAAVRADVMLQAGRVTLRAAKATAWSLLPLGILFMKQFLLRVGLVALVVLLGWFGYDALWPGTVQPAAASPGPATAVAALESVPAAQPTAVRTALAPKPPATTPQVVFHGRCIDAATGTPIAGVAAGAWWIRPGTTRLMCEEDPAEAADQMLTDADGRFSLACDVVADELARVLVGRDDLRQRIGGFGPFAAPQVVDCGDLRMHAGVRVSTRVVDQRGRPVGGVVFSAAQRIFGVADDVPLTEKAGYVVRTRSDGTVPWPSALAPGRYEVHWFEDAIPRQRSLGEMLVPDLPVLANEIVWPVEDEREAIRGLVTDESGQPVAGLELSAEGAGTRGYARCSWNGRFVLPRIGPYDEAQRGPVTIAVRDDTCGYELVNPMPCEWGSRELRLVVRQAHSLVVRAIDPRTGKPLRDCFIHCATLQPGSENTPMLVSPHQEVLADGAVRLGIARLPHLLQVLPGDAALAPSALLRWEPGTNDELTVDLVPTRTVEISVVTTQGEPVAGSTICTLQPIEGGTGQASPMQDVPMPSDYRVSLDPLRRWSYFGIDDAPIDHGTSDANGRVRLRVPTDVPVLIAAFGPGHVPRAVVTSTAGEHIELPVQRGASVRFELSPPELVPRFLPSVRDRQFADNRETSGGKRQRTEFGATRIQTEQDPEHRHPTMSRELSGSSCVCDGLAPGTYELVIYGRLRSGADDITIYQVLETVPLRAGEEHVVPVDLRRWAAGHVRGQVLVNGNPWAFRVGTLERSSLTSVEFHTDGDGRFEADMVCGASRFHLRSLGDHSTYWCAPEPCIVVAGTTTDVLFDVRRVAARVQVVSATDQPAAGVRVAMACATEPHDYRTWTTDPLGWVTIDPAPLVGFELVATNGDVPTDAAPGVRLGPMQVPPTDTTAEFRLRLPENWR